MIAEKDDIAFNLKPGFLSLRHYVKPRDIMTRAAFENAMVIVIALGACLLVVSFFLFFIFFLFFFLFSDMIQRGEREGGKTHK